jgi:hypothetical protein
MFPGTTMKWPKSSVEIEARVNGSVGSLTHDQLVAITS